MIADFRSDTVTKPTQKMRAAIAQAVVGDDVLGDDPTVKEMESLGAKLVGKGAAIFVPSGTMGNQTCIMAQTQRGDEIILEYNCHVRKYEQGGAALLSSCSYATLYSKNGDGIITADQVEDAIRERGDFHLPNTGLICMENATTRGCVVPLSIMEEVYCVGQRHGINVHLDGARLFNAALTLGCSAGDIAQYADSVSFCISKGLGAPVGTLVAGTREFIERARRARKVLGGGMRQSGILAAAGIIALTDGVSRLHEDHENAKFLANGLRELGFKICYRDLPEINMLFIDCEGIIDNDLLVKRLELRGVLCGTYGKTQIRFVTNLETPRSKCEYALEAVREALNKGL